MSTNRVSDLVLKLRQWADRDVHETWRDGSLEPNDILLWAQMMRDAADEIERLRQVESAIRARNKEG